MEFQNRMYVNNFGELEDAITDELEFFADSLCFNNAHIIGEYLYHKVDTDILLALMFEIEAQLRFGGKIDERI